MIEIKFESAGIMSALERLAQSGQRMSPMMRAISTELLSQAEENFSSEGRPKWLGLAPSTIKQRKNEGNWPGMILKRHAGGLADSISASNDATSATIGSNKVYAAIHQFGGTIEKSAQSRQVRHRTDANGNLLRTKYFNGKGLVFAKDKHKRAITRWFEVGAHNIDIPARPFLPISADGDLQPVAETAIVGVVNGYLRRIVG